MVYEKTTNIRVYHYTNSEAYKSMKTKGIDGYFCDEYDNFTGIIPRKRFINLGDGKNLPSKAYNGIIEGLLEPEPESWIKNPEFPNLWNYLMHDICRKDKVMLLSFDILPKDEAYVVERAYVERELYREAKGRGKMTRETRNEAFMKYWNSRINIFEYITKNKNVMKINYAVPQLAIWSGIEFERLNIEWIKSTDEVWKDVCDNKW